MSRIAHAAQAFKEYFRLRRHFDQSIASLTLAKHFARGGNESWKSLDHSLNLHAMNLLKPFAEGIPYEPQGFQAPIGQDAPIWVYWAQGWDEDLPEVVKLCRRKLEENAGGHPVRFLSLQDVEKWENFPEIFMKRFREGAITHTHFSDIVRLFVLKEWGGLYLDAAMLLTRPVPALFWNLPFFTVNHGQGADWLLNQGLWITGVMGTAQGHPLTGWMLIFLERYWTNCKLQICYLLVDVGLRLCMEQNEAFRNQVMNVPKTNPGVFDLVDHYGEACDEAFFQKTISQNFLLRLSQKLPPKMDENSYYQRVLKL